MCVSGVCGDSCSLNSIIVSNWGLPSQCVVVESILSRLLTGNTHADVQEPENRGSGCTCGVKRGKSLTLEKYNGSQGQSDFHYTRGKVTDSDFGDPLIMKSFIK